MKKCNSCDTYFCNNHISNIKKCNSCDTFFCNNHIKACKNCELNYCKNDINSYHKIESSNTSGFKVETCCLNNKLYSKYEGPYITGKKNGFGILIWPNGLKTMQQYVNDQLICERDFTLQMEAEYSIKEAKQNWEEEKIQLKKTV